MKRLILGLFVGFFGFGLVSCATKPLDSVSNAESVAFAAKAARVETVEARWRFGVDARLGAGLGWGYVAALWEKGSSAATTAGNRTIEPVTEFTVHNLVEVGSLTEAFTGILVHLAAIEGKLQLDEKLSEIFPELAGSEAGSISIRELGLHRSGLPREPKGVTIPDPIRPHEGLRSEEVIASLTGLSLGPIPAGETERNRVESNLGYMVLGIVLEKVYHSSFKTLVETRVLLPLGMRESGVNRKARKHGKTVLATTPGLALDGTHLPLLESDNFAAAIGGIDTNAAEMASFLSVLENPPTGKLGAAIAAGMASGIGWDSAPGANPLWKNGISSAECAVLVFDRVAKKGIFIGSNTRVKPDDLGFYAVGARPEDDLFLKTFPGRIATDDEIRRLKGSYRVAAPVGGNALRAVDILEVFGHLVAHFDFGRRALGALLVPASGEDEWRVIDGIENVDRIRVSATGIQTGMLELSKLSNEPEKYPAMEQ